MPLSEVPISAIAIFAETQSQKDSLSESQGDDTSLNSLLSCQIYWSNILKPINPPLLNSAKDHSIEINSFRVNKSYYEQALRVYFDDLQRFDFHVDET